ncbi:hypothetical protein WA577_004971, partial [Blastocystis sp. JDR]
VGFATSTLCYAIVQSAGWRRKSECFIHLIDCRVASCVSVLRLEQELQKPCLSYCAGGMLWVTGSEGILEIDLREKRLLGVVAKPQSAVCGFIVREGSDAVLAVTETETIPLGTT